MKNSKMFSTSIIYLIGQLGSKFISILLLPLYTNMITPEAYGYFDVISAYLSVIIPFACLEVWGGILRFVLGSDNEKYKRKVLNNSMIICVIGMLIYVFAIVIVSKFVEINYLGYIIIYAVTLTIMYMTTMSSRAYGVNKLYMALGIIAATTTSIVSIVCIYCLQLDIETLFISAIVTNLIQIFIVEHKLKIFRTFQLNDIDKKIIIELSKFCFPLAINSVFYFMITNINRIIISATMPNPDYANGVYAIASKLTIIITLLLSVFYMAWQEVNYSEGSKSERELLAGKTYKALIRIIGLGIIVILPATKLVFPYIIGDSYDEAYVLVPFFYLATYYQAIAGFTATFFSIENKTSKMLMPKLIAGILNIGIMFLLIEQFGLVASPISLVISQFVLIISQYMYYRKFLKIKVEVGTILLYTIIFLICSIVYLNMSLFNNIILMLCVIFIAMLLYRKYTLEIYYFILNRIKKI